MLRGGDVPVYHDNNDGMMTHISHSTRPKNTMIKANVRTFPRPSKVNIPAVFFPADTDCTGEELYT